MDLRKLRILHTRTIIDDIIICLISLVFNFVIQFCRRVRMVKLMTYIYSSETSVALRCDESQIRLADTCTYEFNSQTTSNGNVIRTRWWSTRVLSLTLSLYFTPTPHSLLFNLVRRSNMVNFLVFESKFCRKWILQNRWGRPSCFNKRHRHSFHHTLLYYITII